MMMILSEEEMQQAAHMQSLAEHSQHAQHVQHQQHALHHLAQDPHAHHHQMHPQHMVHAQHPSYADPGHHVVDHMSNPNNVQSMQYSTNISYNPNLITPMMLEDTRLQAFRKLSKTLKPAVLLKSWQRICMLVAGIETTRDCGQASIATLEKEIYDRYHGNLNRDPPIVGTVKRAIEDQLDMLATDRFGIKFPKDKISYVQMTASMAGHTIWRYYKELVAEVTNRINLAYRSTLNDDLSFPDNKGLYDLLEETLRILWQQNEEIRKERIVKRVDGPDGAVHLLRHDDSDSDRDGHNDSSLGLLGEDDRLSGRKRSTSTALMNTKPFPGVGKFQPISFLAFLLMGPPAGEKCWNRFALDAHIEPVPPRPRVSMSSTQNHHNSSNRMSTGRMLEDHSRYSDQDDYISPRSDRKRQKKDGMPSSMDEENEAIRIFRAETEARAQRLEELKLALSLFPDDENIKAELKQFIDSQRRTSLENELAAVRQAVNNPSNSNY